MHRFAHFFFSVPYSYTAPNEVKYFNFVFKSNLRLQKSSCTRASLTKSLILTLALKQKKKCPNSQTSTALSTLIQIYDALDRKLMFL